MEEQRHENGCEKDYCGSWCCNMSCDPSVRAKSQDKDHENESSIREDGVIGNIPDIILA